MSTLARILAPDHDRYDGVRPINIWLLRLLYFMMLAFVGTDAWGAIVRHTGPWDHVRAVAFCVWAAYSTLSLLGLIHPLRMLPIMLFMIFYKALWLVVVALPLWRAGALAGSPAEAMTYTFLWIPLPIIAVPWGYVWRTFVLPRNVRQPGHPRARVAVPTAT
jgi:hypothetical protein